MRNKRNNWKSGRPTEHLEPKDFEYYIFCEGQQTEPNYFNGFKERGNLSVFCPVKAAVLRQGHVH